MLTEKELIESMRSFEGLADAIENQLDRSLVQDGSVITIVIQLSSVGLPAGVSSSWIQLNEGLYQNTSDIDIYEEKPLGLFLACQYLELFGIVWEEILWQHQVNPELKELKWSWAVDIDGVRVIERSIKSNSN